MFFPNPQVPAEDANINNRDLLIKAMGFQQSILIMEQYGLWNVMSAVQGAHPHPNPEYRDLIQGNMREMAHGYVLLFYFSIWDHYFDREKSNEVLNIWCTPEEAQRFRAMKHIRHCVAHSFDGKRADQNQNHFNDEMEGPNQFQGILFTDETIDLSGSQIAIECKNFLSPLSGQLVARIAGNDRQQNQNVENSA